MAEGLSRTGADGAEPNADIARDRRSAGDGQGGSEAGRLEALALRISYRALARGAVDGPSSRAIVKDLLSRAAKLFVDAQRIREGRAAIESLADTLEATK